MSSLYLSVTVFPIQPPLAMSFANSVATSSSFERIAFLSLSDRNVLGPINGQIRILVVRPYLSAPMLFLSCRWVGWTTLDAIPRWVLSKNLNPNSSSINDSVPRWAYMSPHVYQKYQKPLNEWMTWYAQKLTLIPIASSILSCTRPTPGTLRTGKSCMNSMIDSRSNENWNCPLGLF